jgi:SAM-dependent methyltransferase
MIEEPRKGYNYFVSGTRRGRSGASRAQALALGRERIEPSRSNPDKIVLQERRHHFEDWLERLPARPLDIVDVGGRIQPYRDLMGERENTYVSVDPQLEGLTDVVAIGESLPFQDSVFDFAICTQVLTYAFDPNTLVREIYRVLKRPGALFLTVPSFFPEHHDERWRFLPDGLREMFGYWSNVEILPEGNSSVGLLRSVSISICESERKSRLKSFISNRLLIPGINEVSARLIDKNSNTAMTPNYSVWAEK